MFDFVALAVLLAAAFGLRAQDPPSLKVDVAVVSVDVTASDTAGNPISNLTKDTGRRALQRFSSL